MKNDISNITYNENVAELKSGKTLKYRILKVKRHVRVKDVKGNLAWQDVVKYIGQKIVSTGWFSRAWKLSHSKMNMEKRLILIHRMKS